MDFRNVLFAIVLSTVVLIVWATFFEPPQIQQQVSEKEISQQENESSPTIEEDELKSKFISTCAIGRKYSITSNYSSKNIKSIYMNIFFSVH